MSDEELLTATQHHTATHRFLNDLADHLTDPQELSARLAALPDTDPTRNARLLAIAAALQYQGKADEGFDMVGTLMEDLDESNPLFAELLNARAWCGLVTQRKELLDDVESLSEWALELCPEAAHFKGTLGSILIAKGELEEGRKLLRQALRGNHRTNKAPNECYLAFADIQEGKADRARRHLEKAKRLDSECHLIPIFESKLEELAA